MFTIQKKLIKTRTYGHNNMQCMRHMQNLKCTNSSKCFKRHYVYDSASLLVLCTNSTFFMPKIWRLSSMYKPRWRSSLHQRQSQFVRCQSAFTNRPKQFRVASKKTTRTQLVNPWKCIHHQQRFFITTNGTNGNALVVFVSYTLLDNTADKVKERRN